MRTARAVGVGGALCNQSRQRRAVSASGSGSRSDRHGAACLWGAAGAGVTRMRGDAAPGGDAAWLQFQPRPPLTTAVPACGSQGLRPGAAQTSLPVVHLCGWTPQMLAGVGCGQIRRRPSQPSLWVRGPLGTLNWLIFPQIQQTRVQMK